MSSPPPKVSVIMPVRNLASHLDSSIGSVASQTYANWELLVIDDGSTDMSRVLALRWATKDSRIRVLENKGLPGVASARNIGIREAAGEWLAFLDGDDVWRPEKLQIFLLRSLQVRSHLFFSSYGLISETGTQARNYVEVPDKISYRKLLTQNSICTSTVMVRRDVAERFHFSSVPYSDFASWLQIIKQEGDATGILEPLTDYRIRKGSLSRNKAEAVPKVWHIYRSVLLLSAPASAFLIIVYSFRSLYKHLRHFSFLGLRASRGSARPF